MFFCWDGVPGLTVHICDSRHLGFGRGTGGVSTLSVVLLRKQSYVCALVK